MSKSNLDIKKFNYLYKFMKYLMDIAQRKVLFSLPVLM